MQSARSFPKKLVLNVLLFNQFKHGLQERPISKCFCIIIIMYAVKPPSKDIL